MNSQKAEALAEPPLTDRLAPNAKIMGGLAPGESADCPPRIEPVADSGDRPFWSVMIPAYNPDADYLAKALRGVLAAGIEEGQMQIEVVDDASTKGDVAAMVRSIAGSRVSVYRQPENLGQRRNWNSCITRARGEWVHLLHADDVVLPGFYARMREEISKVDGVGAAFCRYAHIRGDGQPFYVSETERPTPGILENWPRRLAVMQRIQPPSIVVRRSAYEDLGGFWSAAGSCVDWEMWMRIAARYPVLYHPEVMACYRLHASSGTSFLRQTAAMTADAGKAIERFNAYLPQEQRGELMRLGKQHYARSAYRSALHLIDEKNYEAAIHHVEAALKLDPSPESVKLAEGVMARLPTVPNPERPADVAPCDFFGADEVVNIQDIVAAYRENPSDATVADHLRALRRGLGDFLLHADSAGFEKLFSGNFGTVYRLYLKSGFQNEPLISDEADRVAKAAAALIGELFDFPSLLMLMLYRMAHHQFVPLDLERIPEWFLDDYLGYVLYAPQLFFHKGEVEEYATHLWGWVRGIHRRTRKLPGAALTYRVAKYFALHANFIPLYFVARNTREWMTRRAGILEFFLEKSGAALNAKLYASTPHRRRIKVGFLNAHFASQTETYSTLPTLGLDRSQFEVSVFILASHPGPLEDACRARTDHFTVLPPRLADQVNAIRKAALDVILIGTNVTAVTNQVALLAAHRLAPVQWITNSSPVTSGMKYVDGYVSGTYSEADDASGHYSEKLQLLDGPAHCFDYTVDACAPRVHFDREALGIPKEAVVFVSGANCFKILPELMDAWARILRDVEGARLLLHPFNPNWSSAYPIRQFERSVAACLARHGVDRSRLVISTERLPSRADVKELLRLGDVYLDSYPFAGVNSTVDPLELGIPTVVWDGATFRSRMAGSLLRELGIPSLIATDEAGYIGLAVKLGTEARWRASLSEEITRAMARGPRFLETSQYAKNLGELIEGLFPHRKAMESVREKSETKTAPELSGDPLQAAIRFHSRGQFAEAEECYRQILLANPQNAEAWHLLGVLAHQCGKDESAVEWIEQALQFEPENAVFWNHLAEACNGMGALEKARVCCLRALELQPNFAEAMVTLAGVHRGAGELDEALGLLARALKLKPGYGEGLLQYGLALAAKRDFKQAISIFKKACAAVPDSVEARYHLGVAWEESGRYPEALGCYERAAKCNPKVGEVWHRWGMLLIGLRDYAKAEAILRKAVGCNEADPEYHYQLGRAFQLSNRSQEALAEFNLAIERGGNTPELHNNRGILFKEQGRGFDAVECFYRALKLKPDMISALNNLGAICTDIGMTSEALECIRLLIARRPDLPSAHNNLGKLLKDSGRAAEALASYRRAMELDPKMPEFQHNYLLCLNYVPGLHPREVFEAHRAWGERTVRNIARRYKRQRPMGSAGRKLRIGYVSADFCQHPVAAFIEALFERQDRERFEVTAYCDAKRLDNVTERLRGLTDRWRLTAEMSHSELARKIEEDQIDILVDLSGHTAWNRLELFALRPAPVQVSYLGYPATCGLSAIDYRITDSFADPEGTTEQWHTERLVRLASCAWCYQAPADAPAIVANPSAQTGYVTFGCFNQLAKLNPGLFELWIRLLKRVPGSHLTLKARTLHDPAVKQEIIEFFSKRGIDETRLDMIGYAPSVAGHLGAYRQVDIALDSFPYHGTTTTCEALWMGAPVVTLAGGTHVSRVGVSLLNAMELPELVASSEDEYLAIAAHLAEDEPRRVSLREGMRARMQASPLMNPGAFAASMDEAFLRMWREYAGQWN